MADSSEGAVDCINYALRKMNLNEVSEIVAKKTIGLSLPNTFIELTNIKSIEKVEKFKKYFVERADQVMADKTFIFDKVDILFKKIKRNNMKIGIVSTKFRYRIEDVLVREKLIDYVDTIIGGEDVKQHKPNPEGLLKALQILNLKRIETLYLGDSLTDAKTAENVEIPFGAVLLGTTKKEEFKKYQVLNFILV